MIDLPFPSSELSGHNEGRFYKKSGVVALHRRWAWAATMDAKLPEIGEGDIILDIHFVPPNRRGDRTNFYNRCKPYFDGIADALGVDDRRFVPRLLTFAEPEKPGRVVVTLFPQPKSSSRGMLGRSCAVSEMSPEGQEAA